MWDVSPYYMVGCVQGLAAPAETGDVVQMLYVASRIHHVCRQAVLETDSDGIPTPACYVLRDITCDMYVRYE